MQNPSTPPTPVSAPIRSVLVENISPNATDKTVSDFFSFCGKITKLYFKKQENGESNSAVVEFETESAARTALLLTNALIIDRPITVSEYSISSTPPKEPDNQTSNNNATRQMFGTPTPEQNITQRNFTVPDEERTKTSVIASLLAAGYILGKDTLQKAQEFDEKHQILVKAQMAVDQLKAKAQEIDQTYHISEKVQVASSIVQAKAQEIDQTYHISERVNNAANVAKVQAQTLATRAQENPTIAQGISTLSNTIQNVKQTVTTTYNDYKTQVDRAIEEKEAIHYSTYTQIKSNPNPQEKPNLPPKPQQESQQQQQQQESQEPQQQESQESQEPQQQESQKSQEPQESTDQQ